MKNAARILIAMTIAITTMTAVSSEADAAAPGHQVSVWKNDTPYTVGGRFRWGNGPWQRFTVAPRRDWAVWRPNTPHYVPLTIHFDADPGPGQIGRAYSLKTYYSPTTVFTVPTEVFIVAPNGTIDMRNVAG